MAIFVFASYIYILIKHASRAKRERADKKLCMHASKILIYTGRHDNVIENTIEIF